VIDGLVIGNRVLNFDKSFIIKDLKNGLITDAKFSYKFENVEQKEEGFGSKLFGFFSKKEEPPPLDTVIITIKDNKNNIVCEGNGAWTGQVYFNGKRYWSYDDDYENWEHEKIGFLLPSDSMRRKDLIALKTPDNYKVAEIAHVEILNLQKDDKFFREQYKNNN
jgi:hypothetical protein